MTATVILCVLLALLLVGAFSRPVRTLVGGIVQRDRKGRLVLVLTPARKPKGGGRR